MTDSHFSSGGLSRRAMLTGLASWGAAQLLSGCGGSPKQLIRVRQLQGSIPLQVINQLRRQSQAVQAELIPESQLSALFSLLQTWKQASQAPSEAFRVPGWVPFVGNRAFPAADLVTLGDYWLGKAIQQELIQPLDPGLSQLWQQPAQPINWQALVQRNNQGEPDPKGAIWGVPYRWGSTVIAYRRDIFEQRGLAAPTDWSDLWREDLRQRISVLNQARSVIGFTLKKLGRSFNTTDLTGVPNLDQELDALKSQVKFYSSDYYLQPLLLEDTWLAVGWSADVLRIVQQNPQIGLVIPRSGTALWADLWVRSASSTNPTATAEWMRLFWEGEIARQLSLLSQATAPAVLGLPAAQLPTELQQNPVLLPNAAILKSSEFLLPLPSSAIAHYQQRWQRLRTTA